MSWQPTASLDALKLRSHLNAYIRDFFQLRQVMEVETPLLSQAAVSDVNLKPVKAECCSKSVYLHTSPEYPMKRLLAAGSGDIYQICKVFRDEEQGARHNPEFTMLEYYRLNFQLGTLMDEVAQLVGDFLNLHQRHDYSYTQAMEKFAKVHPFTASDAQLRELVDEYVGTDMSLSRDECLDIIMSHKVEASLPKDSLVFIYNYPASQAALAKTYESGDGFVLAKRFELYVNGLELANGYDELSDVNEQQRRFDRDHQNTQNSRPEDAYFIAALAAGLPDCCGVALGLDRILMLKQNAPNIEAVLAFGFNKA